MRLSESPSESLPRSFEPLGLRPELLAALAELGYEEPTPIQQEAIPLLLEGKDLFGQAATGTGKTAAFALPMLQRMKPGERRAFEAGALVLVPTRELAVQVAEAVHSYGKALGVSVLPIYGGQDIGLQLRRLKHGVDVVVATPGRALDHLRRKTLKLERVQMVVLDEADEMLDMGFAEDLEAILAELPEERQTALFSATLPPRIAAIAERHMRDPARLRIRADKPADGAAPKVRQTAYFVSRGQKVAALSRVLDLEAPRSAIVFCRTRLEVDELTDTLSGHGLKAEALHGGMTQEQRDRVLKRFKAGTTETLVATDVAARGLHVDKLSHVINFDLPTAPDIYVHRIGRTGRAGQEGVAISFADPREHRLLKNIERVTGQRIEMAVVPTAADMRAKKLEVFQASLREALLAGDLAPFQVVVESLSSEFDVVQIATAAVKLAVALGGETGDAFDPGLRPAAAGALERRRGEKPPRHSEDKGPHRPPRRLERGGPQTAPGPAPYAGKGGGGYAAPDRLQHGAGRERPPHPRAAAENFVKIFVNVGRQAGIRPQDLVGAIANEARLAPKRIGSINITDMYSLVEVPEEEAGRVMGALRQTTLRGRKFRVEQQGEDGRPQSIGPRTPEQLDRTQEAAVPGPAQTQEAAVPGPARAPRAGGAKRAFSGPAGGGAKRAFSGPAKGPSSGFSKGPNAGPPKAPRAGFAKGLSAAPPKAPRAGFAKGPSAGFSKGPHGKPVGGKRPFGKKPPPRR